MNKKLLTLFLTLLLSLTGVANALADDFGSFSMDVAEGWVASEAGDDATILFGNEATGEAFSVALAPLSVSITDVVKQAYTTYNGTDLEEVEEGVYAFAYETAAGSAVVMFFEGEGFYLLVSLNSFSDEVSAMLDSVEIN